MSKPLDFQSIMLTLQRFWAENGCLIWQPYYTQVGAGTYNPATLLRVLGPEPWNAGYVEPSVRPDDGRYGENPNRLQQHYQFQVILKPDPGNPQEIYLRSLAALGINPAWHDIRFVEDNWESPALGAWGLGWEVWLDGQEITQFTYFQQAGGIQLDPVSVEITYGLERIAMALQGVRHFKDIQWNEFYTCGDLNLQAEQQHSKYYFETADVERMQELYKIYGVEAEAALSQGLILPAYDYILKCSHTFNILDTRGAIGVTERQAFFGRMRDLTRRTAEAYVEERRQLGFPWLPDGTSVQAATVKAEDSSPKRLVPILNAPADFLLEIGVEELPAGDLAAALEQLRSRFTALLDEHGLEHGEVDILGTPRRLVIYARDIAPRQPDREAVYKGPPASRAFDAAGQPTPAAEGFARGKGVALADLEVREMDGGSYVVAKVQETGRASAEILAEALPVLIAGLHFDKPMRWNASNINFSRPIRWLFCLLGGEIIPFSYTGLESGRGTRGLRFNAPEEFEVHDAANYFAAMRTQKIILDPQERKQTIAGQTAALMQAQPDAAVLLDETLLEEVTHLVESPAAFLGKFEPSFLELPAEVLVSVMKKHQRYFPVWSQGGNLLPFFIGIRNGNEEHLEVVADGNEQVIRARFTDAAFFIQEDLQHKLEDFLPRLGTLMFQAKLGSMLDKSRRVEKLVDVLLPGMGLTAEETTAARRAAQLCKADLVTHMVVEMTSLQGVMGRYYALHSGESEMTARAIFEHYLPRFSGDRLPETKAGLVVGLADRLDSISGLFAAGLAPSGAKDPFAQRRAALGLVQVLMAWNLSFDLRQGLRLAAENLPIEAGPESQTECLEFIAGRLRALLIEMGNRYDVVDAVLAAQRGNPAGAARAVRQLAEWTGRPDWKTILPAYARCARITRSQPGPFTLNAALLQDDEEKSLYEALQTARDTITQPGSPEDFLQAFVPMIPAIDRFFDAILVMAEDSAARANRLGLVKAIADLADGVADFSMLEGF
ncbi:MAG: glycine--tRNA ligase subunit beta [Anaerolineaceae bacterium]|nr:glycine--tRNA ligase subunit beta [Anaerolineaceae bacterium]